MALNPRGVRDQVLTPFCVESSAQTWSDVNHIFVISPAVDDKNLARDVIVGLKKEDDCAGNIAWISKATEGGRSRWSIEAAHPQNDPAISNPGEQLGERVDQTSSIEWALRLLPEAATCLRNSLQVPARCDRC